MPAESFTRANLLLLHRKRGRDMPIKATFGPFTVFAETRAAHLNLVRGVPPSIDLSGSRAGQSKEILPLDR
jgi:hypothetical protein